MRPIDHPAFFLMGRWRDPQLWSAWFRSLLLLLWAVPVLAGNAKVETLLKQGDDLVKNGKTTEALKCFQSAEEADPNHCETLIRIAVQYSDLIFDTKETPAQKKLAEQCLEYARRALKADPANARAHLSMAAAYGKNFPYLDNKTKVSYANLLKQEAEKAIELDPKLDLAYHILGCWHCEIASMGFFMKSLTKLAYGGLPKGTNEQALDNFKKAAELAPGRIIHREQLGHVYVLLDQKTKAIEELKLCLTLKPQDKDDIEARKGAVRRLKKLGVKVAEPTP